MAWCLLAAFLASNSRLPGPRANLELLNAFATAVKSARTSPEKLWNLSLHFCRSTNEFVVMCGIRGVGAVATVNPEAFNQRAMRQLKLAAASPNWRAREAVAMALQDMIGSRALQMKRLDEWVSEGDWLAMRAVAAGVAEPRLLRDASDARLALGLHKRILARVAGTDSPRSEDLRVLKQALAYSLSVVVAAAPKEGFTYLEELIAKRDPDILSVCRENLKKDRLKRIRPDLVQELSGALQKGAR